jgi:hypothetical protein
MEMGDLTYHDTLLLIDGRCFEAHPLGLHLPACYEEERWISRQIGRQKEERNTTKKGICALLFAKYCLDERCFESLLEILEEAVKRGLHNWLADRIICDSDHTCEVGFCVVGE